MADTKLRDLSRALVQLESGESVLEVIIPDQDKIVLNVGGIRHETLVTTLAKMPETRLGELAALHPTLSADEYFFDRNPEVFNAVMDYYRNGELHIPMDVCGVVIKRELEYWNIKDTLIQPCCWIHYCSAVDKVEALESLNSISKQEEQENEDMLKFKGFAKFRLATWRLMCRPNSTTYARIYSILSMMFVMTAITGCCLETVPPLQDEAYAQQYSMSCIRVNVSTDTIQRLLPQPVYALRVLDYLCNAFFSTELLIRLIVAPRPLTFIKSPITIIDIVAILPFYLMLLFDAIYYDACQREKLTLFIQIIFILRIVRVFRVFQMLAYFKPLKILLRSLRDSIYELLILLVFILICMLVFATLAFYAEIEDKDSSFKTIPIGFWWALITITTVGYGDVYPRTVAGYFVGAACALCGTVIMALTIPILSNNFTLYYTHTRTRDRAYVKEKLREQSTDLKKSLADDGTILVRSKPVKPRKSILLEEKLVFRRTSLARSREEVNQEKHILVCQRDKSKSLDKGVPISESAIELKRKSVESLTPKEPNSSPPSADEPLASIDRAL